MNGKRIHNFNVLVVNGQFAKEWQYLIDPGGLKIAIENFNTHCADPSHPYNQIVRYRHKNGKAILLHSAGASQSLPVAERIRGGADGQTQSGSRGFYSPVL